MNEWLSIMLEEIRRKKTQKDEDLAEHRQRAKEPQRGKKSSETSPRGSRRSRS